MFTFEGICVNPHTYVHCAFNDVPNRPCSVRGFVGADCSFRLCKKRNIYRGHNDDDDDDNNNDDDFNNNNNNNNDNDATMRLTNN